MVRELQPGIIVNDRLDLGDYPGGWDVYTPEQSQPQEWVRVDGKPVVWEACQTLNGIWSYLRDNLTQKPVNLLLWMLIDSVSKGGNMLLNVGPNARGEMDEKALASLQGIGKWMRVNGRANLRLHPVRLHSSARLPLHAERGQTLPPYPLVAVEAHPPEGGSAAGSPTRSFSTTRARSRSCRIARIVWSMRIPSCWRSRSGSRTSKSR